MQQKSFTKQSRNQRKLERRKTAVMVVAMMVLWSVVLTMMVTAWAEHPAEQPVNGHEYLESIQGGDY